MFRSTVFSSSHLFPQLISLLLILLSFLPAIRGINDVWRGLGLSNENEMMDMMTTYQMREHEENAQSLTSRNGGSEGTLGQRCGSRNTCSEEENFQCTPAVLGKRCLPATCLGDGLERFQMDIDMEEYKETIFQQAGITEGQLKQEFADAMIASGDRTSFVHTNAFKAIQQAMNQNTAPADAIFGMYDRCTTSVNGTNPNPLSLSRVNYLGLHFEGGIFPIDGALSFLWAQNSTNSYVRYCIGLAGPIGAEISFIYMIAQMTEDVDAILNGCTLRLDVNFGVLANLGVSWMSGLANGLNLLGLTAGLGASFSAGVGFCGFGRT